MYPRLGTSALKVFNAHLITFAYERILLSGVARAKIFYFKRATVFCKQVSSFFSGDYFHCLADVSPTYSNRFPQDNVLTCNLPITKNNEQCDVQRQKAQNRLIDDHAGGN